MIEIQAPTFHPGSQLRVFLAGSIEMGAAEDWQKKLLDILDDYEDTLIVFNPRRDDWDSSWDQSIEDDNFVEQVAWELSMLESADLIAMYFDPNTKSPITLLELGLFARERDKLLVCCPEGYWKKGNVDVVCAVYDIPITDNWDDFVGVVTGYMDQP